VYVSLLSKQKTQATKKGIILFCYSLSYHVLYYIITSKPSKRLPYFALTSSYQRREESVGLAYRSKSEPPTNSARYFPYFDNEFFSFPLLTSAEMMQRRRRRTLAVIGVCSVCLSMFAMALTFSVVSRRLLANKNDHVETPRNAPGILPRVPQGQRPIPIDPAQRKLVLAEMRQSDIELRAKALRQIRSEQIHQEASNWQSAEAAQKREIEMEDAVYLDLEDDKQETQDDEKPEGPFVLEESQLMKCSEIVSTQELDGEPALSDATRREMCRQFFYAANKAAGMYPATRSPLLAYSQQKVETLSRTVLFHSFNRKYVPLFINWLCHTDAPYKFLVYA